MDKTEINALFEQVSENAGEMSESIQQIFSLLLSSTIAFRDLKKDQGITISGEDVQAALDYLSEFMQSQKMPEKDESIGMELFYIWLDDLNKTL